MITLTKSLFCNVKTAIKLGVFRIPNHSQLEYVLMGRPKCTSCLPRFIVLERKLVTLLLRIRCTQLEWICRCGHYLNKRLMVSVLIYRAHMQTLQITHPLTIESYKPLTLTTRFQRTCNTLLLEHGITKQLDFA